MLTAPSSSAAKACKIFGQPKSCGLRSANRMLQNGRSGRALVDITSFLSEAGPAGSQGERGKWLLFGLSAAPLLTIVPPEGKKLTVDDAGHGEVYDLNADPTHVGAT